MTLKAETVIGRRISKLRSGAGLTVDQLADKAGMSGMTIRNLEQGRFSPALATLQSLAAALGVELGVLLSDLPRKRAS